MMLGKSRCIQTDASVCAKMSHGTKKSGKLQFCLSSNLTSKFFNFLQNYIWANGKFQIIWLMTWRLLLILVLKFWQIHRLYLIFWAILKVVVCIARLGYLGPDDCEYMPEIVLYAFGVCLRAVGCHIRYIQL